MGTKDRAPAQAVRWLDVVLVLLLAGSAQILQKLGVRDRVQAVVSAYESGLVQPGGG